MFGEHPISDAVRVARAIVTNQIARISPRLYVRLTHETGRGDGAGETAEDVAAYFSRCFFDYFEILGVSPRDIGGFLQGKVLLEYGPGDVPGVALFMLAHGAQKVYCVDRFPLLAPSTLQARVIQSILDRLPEPQKACAGQCLSRTITTSFDPARLEYLVRPSGLSGLHGAVDLVYSRAVLEHVDDLEGTFRDMHEALLPRGIAIHLADLGSHGLHDRNPLDFLTWPEWLWHLMYSQKGVPNRLRVDRYRAAVANAGLDVTRLEASKRVPDEVVAEVREHLAAPFRGISDEDLSWIGFWLVCQA